MSASNKVEVVIFDWAGTTVDYGCIAPLYVFLELFKSKNVPITIDEAKKPMGMLKRDHIRELFKVDRINKLYTSVYGHEANDETIDEFYDVFETFLFNELSKHTDILPGVLEAVETLRERGIKIGSTSGYTKKMMDFLRPLIEQNGYKPDYCVTSSEVPNGRPYPWMIFQNAMKFGNFNFSHYVKVGDTLVDIQEGVNAKTWSIGVLEGSSLLGLSRDEFNKLSVDELNELKRVARNDYLNAGADMVINSMSELPNAIEVINSKLSRGELPGGQVNIPKQPYLLFTPGPLTTSLRVKVPTLVDWGSRESDFASLIHDVKKDLLQFAAPSNTENYEVILMQGSGTFGVESVVGTVIPKTNTKFLVIINGQYGLRMAQMADILNIPTKKLEFDESEIPNEETILQTLENDPDITHVGIIHSETTTGILNPIDRIASLVKSKNKILIVDCMSSFGAIPFDVNQLGIDFAIGSSNKGFQGIPGFSFIIAKRSELLKCEGNARSLALDMYDQYKFSLKSNGLFRFTPPVHTIRAFYEALQELKDEGGLVERFHRYKENQQTLVEGMQQLGFKVLDLKGYQGPVITTFLTPTCSKYNFEKFYNLLKIRGFVIYPGKLTKANTFRIGSIGDLNKQDVLNLLKNIKETIFWDQ